MTIKSITMTLAALALAACATQDPVPGLDPAGRATVEVTAEPITFFLQGVRGQMNRDPSVQSLAITFTCIEDFDGRSAQTRANRSAQYSALARDRASAWLINPRVKGRWLREIRAQSVPNEGCSPQYKTLQMQTVTKDPVEVMRFVLQHPAAMQYLRS